MSHPLAHPDTGDSLAAGRQADVMRQLLKVVTESDNAFLVGGPDTRVVYANAGFTRMFGYSMADMLGQTISTRLAGPHTDQAELANARQNLMLPGGSRSDLLLYAQSGRPLWVSVVVNPLFEEDGQFAGVVAVLTDITHTKMHEVLQNKVLEAMVRELPMPELMALVCHEVERIAPEVAASILSVDKAGLMHTLAAPQVPRELTAALEGMAAGPQVGSCGTAIWRGEPVVVTDIAADPLWAPYRHLAVPYGLRACWSSPIKGSNGRVLGTFAFYYRESRAPDAFHQRLIEVSLHLCALAMEREESRAHIHHLAFYDTLTSLPNRKMLRSNAERAIAEAQRAKSPLALLFVNIDRFKQVNDAQGHGAGDELLREIASRLRVELRGQDLIGRQGGDEFLAVLSGCTTEQAAQAAERLLLAIAAPVLMSGVTLAPNASIGVAMYPEDGDNYDALVRHADLAMHHAKNDGRGCLRFFSDEMNRATQERFSLEAALRVALRDQGLRLHYQPQVGGTACRELYGVEALARWRHPLLGEVSPARFVPLAEECGLIAELGRWVLGEACRQMADWRARGVAVPRVAVNLSTRNFQDPGLPALVAEQLRVHGLLASDLTLEMTESVMLDSSSGVLATIGAVHAMGVHLSLDDFGTGYSSLSYLHHLPIHELKLDKSFVQDLASSATAQALTNTVLRIGDSLRLTVVAEGVETQLQSDFLTERGCPVLQGYLFARPLPADELERWLAARLAPASR